MQWYADFRHGSARWPFAHEISRAGLYGGRGVFIGLCPFTGRFMTLEGDAPLSLIGGSGSGKGTTKLLYNNFYPGSMLLLSPKGEIGAMIAAYQRAAGKEYRCVNPNGLHTGPPWNLPCDTLNPFDILKPDSRYLVSDCKRIAAMLIGIDPNGKSFFPKRARQWLENLLLAYVLTHERPTLPGLMRVLNAIEGDFERFKALAAVFSNLGNDYIRRTCAEIITKRKDAKEEFSGVVSTLYAELGFMSDPALQALFSGADFSLDILTREHPKAVVEIAFPAENLSIWNKALRLIIGVAMLYQYRAQGGGKSLFIIDEAAQLQYFEELEQSYTYGRSFYRTYAVWQDLGQISRWYGQAGVQTFLGSSQAKIFIGIRDLETAQTVSAMLGTQTIEVDNPIYTARARHARQQAIKQLVFYGADPFQTGLELAHWIREERHRDKFYRPLLTPDEVLNMPEDRSLVFLAGKDVYPIPARRAPYFQRPEIARYFLPNPYHS